jgi:hypothetical protein
MIFQCQRRRIYDDNCFPGDSQGSSTRAFHTPRNYLRVLFFGSDGPLPLARDTVGKQSSMIQPTRGATKDPNYDRWSIDVLYPLDRLICSLRALIPMQRDPLQVEVNCRPEDIGDPSAIVLFWFEKPISVFD